MNRKAINKVRQLNKPQLGSFGESIFYSVASKKWFDLEPHHEARVDFITSDMMIDVKTTRRNIDKALPSQAIYRGPKHRGIAYAFVEFFERGVRVSLDGELLAIQTWLMVGAEYQQWMTKSNRILRSAKQQKPEIADIKGKIKTLFAGTEYKVRVIYRTVQAEFGDESPHNLVPRTPRNQSLTVYLDFYDFNLTLSNIRNIYAFPDSLGNGFALIERPHLHHSKVDLVRIPKKYVFSSWEQFVEEHARIF